LQEQSNALEESLWSYKTKNRYLGTGKERLLFV
jgi:hypothetical protein